MTVKDAEHAEMVDLTSQEYGAFLQREVQKANVEGIESADDFAEAYAAGRLDDRDPRVAWLVGLLGIGQNGIR